MIIIIAVYIEFVYKTKVNTKTLLNRLLYVIVCDGGLLSRKPAEQMQGKKKFFVDKKKLFPFLSSFFLSLRLYFNFSLLFCFYFLLFSSKTEKKNNHLFFFFLFLSFPIRKLVSIHYCAWRISSLETAFLLLYSILFLFLFFFFSFS